MLGAHRDWLHVNGMLELSEPTGIRRLRGRGVLVARAGWSVSRRTGAPGCRNQLFNRFGGDHAVVVADVDDIRGPVETDAGNMRLRTQDALDRLRAAGAMDVLKLKCRVLFRGCDRLRHNIPSIVWFLDVFLARHDPAQAL